MAKALVTGASGFIGGHLVRHLLERGSKVRALVRRPDAAQALKHLGAEVCTADVTRAETLPAALDGVDTVFHLSGIIKAFSFDDFARVNERGVENLLTAAGNCSTPPVVINVSSLAAAGPSPPDRPRTEDDPLAPVANYGRSKRAGEVVCERFADRVPITVVRPPIVFGEGDPAMLSLFKPISTMGFYPAPGLKLRRVSLIHVHDLVQALVLAAEQGARLVRSNGHGPDSCGYYFIADEPCLTYVELGQLISRSLGQQRLLAVRLPDAVAWAVGAAGEVVSRIRRQPGMVNLDKIREAVAGSWICSAERARQELGFRVAAPLAERMRQTAESYQRLGWVS